MVPLTLDTTRINMESSTQEHRNHWLFYTCHGINCNHILISFIKIRFMSALILWHSTLARFRWRRVKAEYITLTWEVVRNATQFVTDIAERTWILINGLRRTCTQQGLLSLLWLGIAVVHYEIRHEIRSIYLGPQAATQFKPYTAYCQSLPSKTFFRCRQL